MKGYWNGIVYMGYIPSMGKYMEFLNDKEYKEWFEDYETETNKIKKLLTTK